MDFQLFNLQTSLSINQLYLGSCPQVEDWSCWLKAEFLLSTDGETTEAFI